MKVLSYTSPARGHLFPTVPLLLELQRRGHTVEVRTLGAEVGAMRDVGFIAEPITSEIEALTLDDYRARSSVAAIRRVIDTLTRRAVFEVPEIERAIVDGRPDLLLIDTNAWGAAIAAEAWGGPWALLQHFPTPLPAAEVPPFGPGFAPATGVVGRLRDRVLRPVIHGAFERSLLPPLNGLRQGAGLRPVRDLTDLYTRPPLTLYLTSTAFEYPRREWPESFCFIGPLAWDPPSDPPSWLAEIERPIVLVTTSSEFQDDGALVSVALAGLAEEPSAVVATVPAGADVTPVLANARVETFVPHSHLLPRTEVAVTHGGMGATQKALAAGVPVVVVPWGRDQAEVGRRAETAGVAVLLPRKKLSPTTLRDAVRRARALRPRAETFAASMRREGGAAMAADRLEGLVA